MTDWTVIAAASVGGATGVLGGAISAKVQAKSVVRQVEVQLELLRKQQLEEHRHARIEAYLQSLDAERTFQLMHQTNERIDREVYRRWQEKFDHAYNTVKLRAAPSVQEAVRRFTNDFPRKLRIAFGDDVTEEDYSRYVHASYRELLPRIRKHRDDLYTAMQGGCRHRG